MATKRRTGGGPEDQASNRADGATSEPEEASREGAVGSGERPGNDSSQPPPSGSHGTDAGPRVGARTHRHGRC
jgi:hypothetical protein